MAVISGEGPALLQHDLITELHHQSYLSPGTSQAVRWLGLCASTAGGMRSIAGLETNILHAGEPKKKKKEKTKKLLIPQ